MGMLRVYRSIREEFIRNLDGILQLHSSINRCVVNGRDAAMAAHS